MFTNALSRISPRTKLILTAVIAFALGTGFRSGGAVGRYQFHPSSPSHVIDTQTGNTFQYSETDRTFKTVGTLPWR